MTITFLVQDAPIVVSDADPSIIGGEDIGLRDVDFTETDAGDWGVVSGVQAARQSVEREIPASNGSFPRRQKWGGNVGALLFKGATRASRDLAVSQATACLHRNKRIKNVIEVSARPPDTSSGTVLTIRADSVDGPVTAVVANKARLP